MNNRVQVWEYENTETLGQELVTRELSRPQRAILESLGVFEFLTAEQLTRLLYRSSSHAYVQRNLSTLVRSGYLTTLLPPKQTRFGSTPYVYTLTTPGRNYVTRLGLSIPGRFRPSEIQSRRGGFLLHTLAVNEVLLLSHLLVREQPDLELVEFAAERELIRDPMRVSLPPDNKQVTLSPDLWLDFRRNRVHYTFCVEVNLTPVEQKRWRRKVASYLYCLPSYKARFGTDAINVAVIVASPSDFPKKREDASPPRPVEVLAREAEIRRREKRTKDLLLWTEAELRAQNSLHEADLFCIGEVGALGLTPESLFLSPRFFMPTHPGAVALISEDEEEVPFG